MGGAGEITITRMYDMRKESMVNKTKKALSGGGNQNFKTHIACTCRNIAVDHIRLLSSVFFILKINILG